MTPAPSRACSSTCSWRRTQRAQADRARSGCDRRSAARRPGGALLPRLLRLLLLSAALRLLRPSPAGRQAAARQHRCGGRRGRGGGADRRPDPPPLAQGAHLLARRLRLRPRGTDGLVRGQRRRLSVRPGQERAAGRRDRGRAGAGHRGEPAHRPAGAPLQGLPVDDARQLEPRRRVVAKAEHTAGKPIRASSSPRSRRTSVAARSSTRSSIARAARWRTASRNASSICSPTAPRRPPCAPISSACGSPPWPMCCSARCAASGSSTPSSPRQPAARSASSCFKIGALVRVSVRRITLAMASGHPYQRDFARAHAALTQRAL